MRSIKIGIIGLGYVGLPLALELGKFFKVNAYDKKKVRILNLKKNVDHNNEHKKNEFLKKKIEFSNDDDCLKTCNFYIICVPTPINKKNKPDLRLLKKSCELVGKYIEYNDTVVFESTVYPGVTENICGKILEKISGIPIKKNSNKGFYLGYSPERVNPGDKVHKLKDIVKIVSSSSNEGLKKIYFVYSKIIKAGLHVTKNIKIAETAKVIENVQRDVNIALVNEISLICNKLKINTYEVLKAASTKWNFLKFYPGLVGGHCVGVDPYYLIEESKRLNFNPSLMITSRKINNTMVNKIKKRVDQNFKSKSAKILFLGVTFKEDCSDLRNSQYLQLAKKLNINHKVKIHEPHLGNLKKIDGIINVKKFDNMRFDIIIFALAHKNFKKFSLQKIKKISKKNTIVFDLKNIFKNKNFQTF